MQILHRECANHNSRKFVRPPYLDENIWRDVNVISWCVPTHITHASLVPGLCEVETGQSNIILDIEESRGTRKLNF